MLTGTQLRGFGKRQQKFSIHPELEKSAVELFASIIWFF